MNAKTRASLGCLSSISARKRARRQAGLARYESEIRLHRGKCRAPGCASRWGVTRVTLDFTASRERIARDGHVECAQCGRVWHRIKAPDVTHAGYQQVLLTVIVPSGERRIVWARNGAIHAQGDDQLVIVNPTLAQAQAGFAGWSKRNAQLTASRERAKSKREALAAADRAATRDLLARIAAREAAAAEAAAEEAAAAAREAAGQS
jgi:hypothetical protein